MMEKISVVIAVAAPVVAAGFSHILRRLPGFQASTVEVGSLEELEECLRASSPSMVLVDPALGGVFDPQRFRRDFPGDYSLLAIEMHQLQPSTRALYDDTLSILDDVATLSSKLQTLFCETDADSESAKYQLSRREKEIVALVVKGLTNKEISERLFVSIHTVTTHRRNIARKLEIHSATGLTIYAIVNHIVELSDLNL